MPINILFVESESLNQDSIEFILKDKAGIQYDIIKDFDLLQEEININEYTHLIAPFILDDKLLVDYLSVIKIPLLVVSNQLHNLTHFPLNYTKPPLIYSTLFDFICEKLVISYETLDNYANGNEVFLNKLKEAIVTEFKLNMKELPLFIESNNLVQIQNNVHKLISKFAFLNMMNSYHLALEVDKKIIEDTDQQLNHLNQLLVDIEIALIQLT
jgi:hypothetical protein